MQLIPNLHRFDFTFFLSFFFGAEEFIEEKSSKKKKKLSLYVEETTTSYNPVGFTSREGNLAQTPLLSVDYITCDPNAQCTATGK